MAVRQEDGRARGRGDETLVCSSGRRGMAEVLRPTWESGRGAASVVALGGAGLIEHEVRFGLSVGRIVGRRLIEEEVALGRATGR